MLKRHLAQAKVHIETGRKNIARQRRAIAKLERGGQDAKEARAALAQFEELQAMHLADRDRNTAGACAVGRLSWRPRS
jgi:hypothetical protein